MSKVLILAISDKYWVDFAVRYSERLSKDGIESIIVMDSRIGEYQLFFNRIQYASVSVYYLSDYTNRRMDIIKNNDNAISNNNFLPIYNDYLRLKKIGLLHKLVNKDLSKSYSILSNFLEEIYNENDISLVVHETVSSSFSYVASAMANQRNIPYIGFVSAKVPNRFEVKTSISSDADKVMEIYDQIINHEISLSEDEIAWGNDYLNSIDNQIQGFMKTGTLNNLSWGNLFNNKNFKLLFGTILYTLRERKDINGILFKSRPIDHAIASLKRNFLRRLRKPFLKKFFDEIDEKWLTDNKFYIYPLHFQPEASTTVGAPFFDDQLALLTQISFLLPRDAYLLIKEHRSNIGYNNFNFFKELKALPNVRLISEEANIKNMIRKAEALITLTGTAGFEAVLLDTPVFIFGNVSYAKHPLCKSFTSWSNFELEITHWINESKYIKYNNNAFLNAYKKFTYIGNVDYNQPEFNIGDELFEITKNSLKAI